MQNTDLISFNKSMHKYLFIVFSCLYCLPIFATDSDFNPHELGSSFSENDSECLACHKIRPQKTIDRTGQHVLPKLDEFVKNSTAMCTDCHGEENTSHIVGVTPEYIVPADLPLDSQKQISCLTCHYTHGKLTSEKTMASSSFMDRLFNRERLNKSYILRRNNADGDLCLACHTN